MYSEKFSSLLKKYNVPGPRYTSYPTVPYWDCSPTQEEWIASLKESFQAEDGKSVGAAVYIHIPFCRSLCTYCGCNTRITRKMGVGVPYVQTVLKEWDLYLKALGQEKIPLSEIHLGGGTPTFLSSDELRLLIEGIVSRSFVLDGAEFSLEADPRVTTKDQLVLLRELGFTRLSLGIQDFDPKVQDIVHRIQSVEQVKTITDQARELGFDSINYDLIYGLPLQTMDSVKQTIREVRELKPDRIAFYAYAHVPWIRPGQRRFTEADLPSGAEKHALYEGGRQLLEEAGYRDVGMDHFALETDSLWQSSQKAQLHRNFMGYTSRYVNPLIGLGVSAIGDSWNVFSQNEKLLETYQKRVNEKQELPLLRGHVLTEEDRVIRRHILNLMTQFQTSWESKDEALFASIRERATSFIEDGLLVWNDQQCQITEMGKAFIRNICMIFDLRLLRKAPETKIFSQTV